MTLDYFRNLVVENVNNVCFTYHGKTCGMVFCGTMDDFFIYYGDEKSKIVNGGFDAVIREPFFDGKSILELLDLISETICVI